MTTERVLADLEEQLELRIRARLLLAEQASSEGDRWSCEIQKARVDELDQFGRWLAAHFHLPAGYGG